MTGPATLRPAAAGARMVRTVLLVLCAAWGATSLTYPFGWDQGIMASVGDAMLHGGMPYREAWDIKGPVAHVWFATARLLSGRAQWGIRVLDLALLLWAALSLARVGGRLTRVSAGPWIAIGLVLAHASLGYFYTAQPDGAVSLGLAVAFAPLLAKAPGRRALAVAGAVVGVAMLMKPLYVVFLLIPFLVVVQADGPNMRERFTSLVIVGVATALPVAAMLGWFAARGALDEMIDVYVRYNASSYSGVTDFSLRQRVMGVVQYFLPLPRALALGVMLIGTASALRRDRRRAVLVIGWFLGAVALVVSQGKFFVYHWAVIFPSAGLLLAYGIDAIVGAGLNAGRDRPDTSSAAWRTAVGAVAVLGILLPLARQPLGDVVNAARLATRVDSRAQYYARFGLDDRSYVAADQMAAAEYIEAHTSASDRVAIFGYDAPVLYLSQRTNATPFSYALPLVGHRSTAVFRERYRRAYLAALADPPAYVVVGLLFSGKEKTLADFPEFRDFLAQHFVLETSFGNVDLYRRRGAASAVP